MAPRICLLAASAAAILMGTTAIGRDFSFPIRYDKHFYRADPGPVPGNAVTTYGAGTLLVRVPDVGSALPHNADIELSLVADRLDASSEWAVANSQCGYVFAYSVNGGAWQVSEASRPNVFKGHTRLGTSSQMGAITVQRTMPLSDTAGVDATAQVELYVLLYSSGIPQLVPPPGHVNWRLAFQVRWNSNGGVLNSCEVVNFESEQCRDVYNHNGERFFPRSRAPRETLRPFGALVMQSADGSTELDASLPSRLQASTRSSSCSDSASGLRECRGEVFRCRLWPNRLRKVRCHW